MTDLRGRVEQLLPERIVRCAGEDCKAEALWRRWALDGWINVTTTRPGKYHNRTEDDAAAKVTERFYCSEQCLGDFA